MTTDAQLAAWAASTQIPLSWPRDYSRNPYDFSGNPCIDFGRVVSREPRFVLRPRSTEQLSLCMEKLLACQIPYHTRGAAHSSGGQSLSDGGAIISTAGLNRILDDRPYADQIVVQGGTHWLSVIERLQVQGRRPVTLTDNPRLTVAGTFSVGGFGDTTPRKGLSIRQVDELTLVTPDGSRRRLRPGDELFHFALAGRGQLGIIADATIRTVRQTFKLAYHLIRWNSMSAFLRDVAVIAGRDLYDYVRVRAFWTDPIHIAGGVGNFTDSPDGQGGSIQFLAPDHVGDVQQLDMLESLRRGPGAKAWKLPTPAMEFALPLPVALDLWPKICERIVSGGLARFLRNGSSVMVTPPEPDYPLAPVTSASATLLIALRPQVPAALLGEALPVLREIGEMALDAGGRIYLMSIELDTPNFLERQFGVELAAKFRALKARVDPANLCNPGLLDKTSYA